MKAKLEVTYGPWTYEAVSLHGLDWPRMQPVMNAVKKVYNKYGFEAVISSGTECWKYDLKRTFKKLIHHVYSLHYRGRALDFSIKNIPMLTLKMMQEELQNLLGDNYDVCLEKNHFHIEYDPK